MANFDIGIIGAGVAGSFAALRLAEHHKKTKAILFDFGRPPGKRRRQLEGWFGCFPTGDGKIYTDNIDNVLKVADGRRVKSINKWFMNHLNEVFDSKIIKNKPPNISLQKKIKELGFDIGIHDYTQWKPENIHQLSRKVADKIESGGNVTFSFDNEVLSIDKNHGVFTINTQNGIYTCKKVILCVGRSSWRWVNDLYKSFGILKSDDYAKFGIKVELSAQYMKDFNGSHCSFSREDLVLGPFSWQGSIIQEDHANLTVTAFRSNENRWKTDKVFFSLIKKVYYKNEGTKQTDRLGRLSFLLAGDRVGREKVKTFMNDNSQISLIPEFKWLKESINEVNSFIPALISRGYFHYPDIVTTTSDINVKSNLETDLKGLYVAGESAGIKGIAAAGITGAIAAESAK